MKYLNILEVGSRIVQVPKSSRGTTRTDNEKNPNLKSKTFICVFIEEKGILFFGTTQLLLLKTRWPICVIFKFGSAKVDQTKRETRNFSINQSK